MATAARFTAPIQFLLSPTLPLSGIQAVWSVQQSGTLSLPITLVGTVLAEQPTVATIYNIPMLTAAYQFLLPHQNLVRCKTMVAQLLLWPCNQAVQRLMRVTMPFARHLQLIIGISAA